MGLAGPPRVDVEGPRILFSEAFSNTTALATTARLELTLAGATDPGDPRSHFKFSPYQQPFMASAYFDVLLVNLYNKSNVIPGRIGSNADTAALEESIRRKAECFQRVVCIARGKWSTHLPHFGEKAFPCWAGLQRFLDHERFIMNDSPPRHGWNAELTTAFKKAGITFVRKLEELPKGAEKCNWGLEKKSGKGEFAFPTLPTLKVDSKGTIDATPDDAARWTSNPITYFSRPEDAAALQRVILGSDYLVGPSTQPKIKVLILNRKGSRHLTNGDAIVSGLKGSVFGDAIEVVHVHNMEGSLRNQALTMHRADIIISPHGAQLTNLAFIKPCTVVAEIFPRGYYTLFFQGYVTSAGGISYEAIELGRVALVDLFGITDYKTRVKRRSGPLPISAGSVVRALPMFILSFNQCRSNARSSSATPLIVRPFGKNRTAAL